MNDWIQAGAMIALLALWTFRPWWYLPADTLEDFPW